MDLLLPVFVSVVLAETGGRVQALTSALRLRFPEGASAIATALVLTSLVSLVVAAVGGAIISEMIDFRARTLLSGLALIFAGAPMLIAKKPPKVHGAKPLAASFRAFIPTQFGDASQFIVFAMAARGGLSVLALIAGLAGIFTAAALPLLLASDWPGKFPLLAVRRVAGVILLIAGFGFAASAFRVI